MRIDLCRQESNCEFYDTLTYHSVWSNSCHSYNQESPDALQKLHVIGDQEEGWLQIIISMINIVPVADPLGPAAITVVLDDCPLPNKVCASATKSYRKV